MAVANTSRTVARATQKNLGSKIQNSPLLPKLEINQSACVLCTRRCPHDAKVLGKYMSCGACGRSCGCLSHPHQCKICKKEHATVSEKKRCELRGLPYVLPPNTPIKIKFGNLGYLGTIIRDQFSSNQSIHDNPKTYGVVFGKERRVGIVSCADIEVIEKASERKCPFCKSKKISTIITEHPYSARLTAPKIKTPATKCKDCKYIYLSKKQFDYVNFKIKSVIFTTPI